MRPFPLDVDLEGTTVVDLKRAIERASPNLTGCVHRMRVPTPFHEPSALTLTNNPNLS